MNNQIIVLTGLSASGKDSLSQIIKDKLSCHFVVSHTTRPMRPNEVNGNPYFFVSEDEFNSTKMIERRKYETLVDNKPEIWYYGVSEGAILDNRRYVVVLDVQGTQEFIKHFGDRVIPIYIHVDAKEREKRSIERGGHDKYEWERRERDDLITFTEENVNNIYLAKIENTDLEKTVDEIIKVVKNYG